MGQKKRKVIEINWVLKLERLIKIHLGYLKKRLKKWFGEKGGEI